MARSDQLRKIWIDNGELPNIKNIHTAELRLSLVKRRLADAVMTAHIRCLLTRLMLAQDPNDLFFAKS